MNTQSTRTTCFLEAVRPRPIRFSQHHRSEDIAPNIAFELDKFAGRNGRQAKFNLEALKAYLDFALSPSAKWPGNFRDLNASVTRMATLAGGGRIDVHIVEREINRLAKSWSRNVPPDSQSILHGVLPPEAMNGADGSFPSKLYRARRWPTSGSPVSANGCNWPDRRPRSQPRFWRRSGVCARRGRRASME